MHFKINPDFYNISSKLDSTNTSYTYGEVFANDIIKIIKNIYGEDVIFEYYSFIDIGCGIGNLLIEIETILKLNCYGVEIEPTRFEESIKQLETNTTIEIFNKDFKNLYFGNYDILYCCNFVFSKEDNNTLYKKILNEFNGYVLLFDYNHVLKSFYQNEYIVKTSWNPEVKIFVFKI